MKTLIMSLSIASSFQLFGACGLAATLTGRIFVTKDITRKHITLPLYQLRGVSLSSEFDGSSPVNDYRRVAVFLEGGLPNSTKALQVELQQRDRRFEPEILVIPIGSTVSFPNADPIFTTCSLCPRPKSSISAIIRQGKLDW